MDSRTSVRVAEPEHVEPLVALIVGYIAEANPSLRVLTGRTIVEADADSVRHWIAMNRQADALVLVALSGDKAEAPERCVNSNRELLR